MGKFLRFTQHLALLGPLAGCASSTPAPPSPPPAPTTATTATAEPSATAGTPEVATGPCRCSWDTNASAAPRVCKKGEPNYDGIACVPAGHPKWNGPVKGPLPPPDLPA